MRGILGSGKSKAENYRSVDIRQIARTGGLMPDSARLWTAGASFTVEWTPCRFGGRRPWFLCPVCRYNAAILYAAGDTWACRKCLGLSYASQSECALIRVHNRLVKIENRLEKSKYGESCGRPKGMHRRTYARLMAERAHTERVLWSI